MRAMKFRAWDKTHKCWLRQESGPNSIVLYGNGEIALDGGYGTLPLDIDVDLMQYTGLQDKNGKEIYEGDIVRGKHWERFGNGEVLWYLTGWYTYSDYLGWTCLRAVEGPEVIGNIHENPELLKRR